MADFDSSLPIRTENPGDVISKIADATIPSQQLTVNADGSLNITDNGGSLTVDATDLDIRDLVFASDKVDVTGSDITATVSATDLDIRDLNAAQDNVAISDGTDQLEINADGSINSVVTATDLDIRDLTSASDSVEVLQATHDNLNGNMTIQIADVDVSNANPVPVSDAGGSLTVDAVNLDIRDLVFATDKVDVSGSSISASNFPTTVDTNYGTVGANTLRSAAQIGNATGAADFNNGASGAQTLRVAANLAIGGANVTASNPVPVVIEDSVGDAVNDYKDASSIAAAASDNHDYVVTALKTLHLNQIEGSASGKAKMVVQVETALASGIFTTRWAMFNSTADTNMQLSIKNPIQVAAGVRVRIIMSNLDKQAQDLYSTISGYEV